MKKVAIYLALPSYLFLLVHCGSNPSVSATGHSQSSIHEGPIASTKLVIYHSRSANTREAYGSIKVYKVTVTGEKLEPPLEMEFDGEAESIVMEGIPVGSDRYVHVVAINQNDRIIREGEVRDVVIRGGEINEVDIELDAVPIFTNLSDNNVVPSTRLKFELFADPEDPLEIEDRVGGSSDSLFDLSTGLNEVFPDLTTGIARMWPKSVLVGDHQFTVLSKRTGKSSTVSVKVIDGKKIDAAPFFSAGRVWVAGSYMGVTRSGSPMGLGPRSGALWSRILESKLGGGI